MTFDNAEDVLRFYLKAEKLNQAPALVVLSNVTGGTLRAQWAMMAVTQREHAGYISNGCVDADVIYRARDGQSGLFIYGDGSPFRDITLPCGGRLEVGIFQSVNVELLRSAIAKLSTRQVATVDLGGGPISLNPRLRLRIAGRGAAVIALAEMAENCGFDVHVQSPEPDGFRQTEHLIDQERPPQAADDDRTAMVCLFHDHDWEVALLKQALDGPCFYVGAMGSQRTHDTRRKVLRELGCSESGIDDIKAPIGLVPAQRDARFLAVSILAEILLTAKMKGLV